MLGTLVVLGVLALLLYHLWHTSSNCYRMVEKLHGPSGPDPLPILGNSLIFSTDSLENYNTILKFAKEHKRIFRVWLGRQPYVFGYNVQDAEVILSSTSHITKSDAYKFATPWIGTGLLTATGSKWKNRRRIITPTFHFKILEEFVEVFNDNAQILVRKLRENINKEAFNVYPYCSLFALDNICETAMGVQINAQIDSNSKYVQAIKDMCLIVNVRVYQPWLSSDIIFNLSKWGKLQKNALSIIHGHTNTTIKERRQQLKTPKVEVDTTSENCIKRKLAFLDLLLQTAESSTLTDEDIREEVDTFMFEGHDTVTSGVSSIFYELSQNPLIQDKVYEEQIAIFGESDRSATFKDYQDMNYLERVLKECERLYPSVPIIGRYMHQDLQLSDGLIIPKGTQMNLLLPVLHRSPAHWEDPDKFNPDNFLPEVASKRHPYAFVPFSAGPRNCIGQKYATLEMKACISTVIRNFKLKPCGPKERVSLVAELVLISRTGFNIKVSPR